MNNISIYNNFVASTPNNVRIGSNVHFYQQTIFNGQGEVFIGSEAKFGYHLAPHFHGFHELIQARTNTAKIFIGEFTHFSNDISIVAFEQITIGSYCLIGDRVTMMDCDAHETSPATRRKSEGKKSPITIGNNVWIGSMVTILKGVQIGDNSVIQANSLVTKHIPANCIAGGNPAIVIKSLE